MAVRKWAVWGGLFLSLNSEACTLGLAEFGGDSFLPAFHAQHPGEVSPVVKRLFELAETSTPLAQFLVGHAGDFPLKARLQDPSTPEAQLYNDALQLVARTDHMGAVESYLLPILTRLREHETIPPEMIQDLRQLLEGGFARLAVEEKYGDQTLKDLAATAQRMHEDLVREPPVPLSRVEEIVRELTRLTNLKPTAAGAPAATAPTGNGNLVLAANKPTGAILTSGKIAAIERRMGIDRSPNLGRALVELGDRIHNVGPEKFAIAPAYAHARQALSDFGTQMQVAPAEYARNQELAHFLMAHMIQPEGVTATDALTPLNLGGWDKIAKNGGVSFLIDLSKLAIMLPSPNYEVGEFVAKSLLRLQEPMGLDEKQAIKNELNRILMKNYGWDMETVVLVPKQRTFLNRQLKYAESSVDPVAGALHGLVFSMFIEPGGAGKNPELQIGGLSDATTTPQGFKVMIADLENIVRRNEAVAAAERAEDAGPAPRFTKKQPGAITLTSVPPNVSPSDLHAMGFDPVPGKPGVYRKQIRKFEDPLAELMKALPQ